VLRNFEEFENLESCEDFEVLSRILTNCEYDGLCGSIENVIRVENTLGKGGVLQMGLEVRQLVCD